MARAFEVVVALLLLLLLLLLQLAAVADASAAGIVPFAGGTTEEETAASAGFLLRGWRRDNVFKLKDGVVDPTVTKEKKRERKRKRARIRERQRQRQRRRQRQRQGGARNKNGNGETAEPFQARVSEPCAASNLPGFRPGVPVERVISFVAMGDAPYSTDGRYCLNAQLRNLDLTCGSPADCPSFIVHIGDIKTGSAVCDEASYGDVADIFAHPSNRVGHYDPRDVFFTPGDNEWNDCPSTSPPHAVPWERWYRNFGPGNPDGFGTLSDGGDAVRRQTDVERLSGIDRGENFAFFREGTLFVGVNNVGGASPGDESVRLVQNFHWVRDNMKRYDGNMRPSEGTLEALVVFGHASLDNDRWSYFGNPLIQLLRTGYPHLPAIYLHGDTHGFCVGHPDERNPNFADVEVEDGASAPPLLVSLLKEPVSGKLRFVVDQQGGLYRGSCPKIKEKTWS